MKLLLTFFILTCIFPISRIQAQGNSRIKNSLTERKIKGNIKSIQTLTYKAIDTLGLIQEGELCGEDSKEILDEHGNPTKWVFYNKNDSIPYEHNYTYDKDHRMICDYISYNGNIQNYTRNTYNKKGYLIKSCDTYCWIYKYDRNGNNTMAKYITTQKGISTEKFVYSYDSLNNPVKRIEYTNKNDTLIETGYYKYDKNNFLIEVCFYGTDNKFRYKSSFTYEIDNKGNWTKQIEYLNDKPINITLRNFEYY